MDLSDAPLSDGCYGSLQDRPGKAEDGIRLLKTGLGLETVRAMRRRLRHMMALALLAITVVVLATAEPESWRTALIRRGRSRLVHADFLFCPILRGIVHLLQRHPLFWGRASHRHIPDPAV